MKEFFKDSSLSVFVKNSQIGDRLLDGVVVAISAKLRGKCDEDGVDRNVDIAEIHKIKDEVKIEFRLSYLLINIII